MQLIQSLQFTKTKQFQSYKEQPKMLMLSSLKSRQNFIKIYGMGL